MDYMEGKDCMDIRSVTILHYGRLARLHSRAYSFCTLLLYIQILTY